MRIIKGSCSKILGEDTCTRCGAVLEISEADLQQDSNMGRTLIGSERPDVWECYVCPICCTKNRYPKEESKGFNYSVGCKSLEYNPNHADNMQVGGSPVAFEKALADNSARLWRNDGLGGKALRGCGEEKV